MKRLLLLSVVFFSLSLNAATFTVDVQDDRADPVPGDGVCGLPSFVLGGPWCSLRAAVQEANEIAGQDTIVLSNLTYELMPVMTEEDDDDLSVVGDLNVFEDLIIEGNGGVIDAGGGLRIFELESVKVEMKNITLKNAYSATDGGAIFAIASSLKLEDTTFENNNAEADGGAIFMLGGRLEIDDAQFDNNIAGLSGGAISIQDSSFALNNTTFFENYSEQGGAIYSGLLSEFVVGDSNFWANTAGHFGGAVMIDGVSIPNGYNDNGNPLLEGNFQFARVNFGGNEAAGGAGGGIYIESLLSTINQAVLNLVDCDFQDNGGYSGGAVGVYSGQVNFENCNFVNNEATGEDGVGGAIFSNSDVYVQNSSFRENTSYSSGGAIYTDSDLYIGNSIAEENESFGDNELLGMGLFYAGQLIDLNDVVDSDLDGILDTNDNCPFVANEDQSNVGGTIVGAGDEYGDACQCGDVNNSGTVDNTDAVLIVRFAAGLPPGVDAAKCDVTGDEVCDNSDADQIRGYLLGTSTNSLQQCAAALPISVVEGGDSSQTTGESADSEGSDDALDTDTFNSEELQEYNIPVPAVISLMLLLVFTTVVSRRRIKI